MKNFYIPKGKTLNYESVTCQDIVNDGTLIVEGCIHARRISGQGVVNAGAISCRSLSASDINAAYITTGKLTAEHFWRYAGRLSPPALAVADPPNPHGCQVRAGPAGARSHPGVRGQGKQDL